MKIKTTVTVDYKDVIDNMIGYLDRSWNAVDDDKKRHPECWTAGFMLGRQTGHTSVMLKVATERLGVHIITAPNTELVKLLFQKALEEYKPKIDHTHNLSTSNKTLKIRMRNGALLIFATIHQLSGVVHDLNTTQSDSQRYIIWADCASMLDSRAREVIEEHHVRLMNRDKVKQCYLIKMQ